MKVNFNCNVRGKIDKLLCDIARPESGGHSLFLTIQPCPQGSKQADIEFQADFTAGRVKRPIKIHRTLKDTSNNRLWLIPTPLGKQKKNTVLPEETVRIIHSLDCFVVEKPQTALGFLRWIGHPVPDYQLTIRVLNKRTPDHEVHSFLKLLEERPVGLLSEAGAPGVADPGARLVRLAHSRNYPIVPLVGPSSILLALMASGLNGQSFAFHGYLPLDEKKRDQKLRELEGESLRLNRTQIFMETPFRNEALFQQIMQSCKSGTLLSISCQLTLPDEFISTKTIYEWKKSAMPDIQKKPALFMIYSGS